jgi:hypothetical protein
MHAVEGFFLSDIACTKMRLLGRLFLSEIGTIIKDGSPKQILKLNIKQEVFWIGIGINEERNPNLPLKVKME